MTDDQVVMSLVPIVASRHTELNFQGYYRSKLLSIQDDLSPFVSAAGPIFSLLDRFSVAHNLPPIEKILTNIDHELKAYYSRLLSQPHSESQKAIAYYLLCVTIDEVLVRSYLRLYHRPPTFKAFTPASYTEEEPGTKFFSLITYLKHRPFDNLPLLELAYCCLMAGFEGEQHGRADGRQVLEAQIDELFRLIQQYRQEVRMQLFDRVKHQAAYPKPYKRFVLVGICLSVVLIVCFNLAQVFLEYQAKKIRFAPAFMMMMDE